MRKLPIIAALLVPAGSALAHVTDAPLLLHALEHGWLALAAIPLLLLLLPLGRERR